MPQNLIDFPLVAIIVLGLTTLAILVLHLVRPRFAYFWLVAGLGALIAWPFTLLSRLQIPRSFSIITWSNQVLFPDSPNFMVDFISWPYALAIATLVLAVMLTDVARAADADWLAWAGVLALGAVGMLAVLAGNPLTLLLAWAAIDIIELVILFSNVRDDVSRERVVIALTPRLGSILLLIWSWLSAESAGVAINFSVEGFSSFLPPGVSISLILAAGLRLGVIPPHYFYLQEDALRRGLGTMLRLVHTAAGLILLGRINPQGIPENWQQVFLILVGLAALYASIAFASAKNELDGRPFWVLAIASIAVAASIRGDAAASVAWGVSALLAGGLLFLMTARTKVLRAFIFLGSIGISALPLTPGWRQGGLYAAPFHFSLILLLAAQAFLLAGYLKHGFRHTERLEAERWVWLIYPWGLVLLVAAHWITGWWGESTPVNFTWLSWIAGILSLLGTAGLAIGFRRGTNKLAALHRAFLRILSLGWLYRLLWIGYRFLTRLFNFVSSILEGDGGILWALLLLTLLMTYFANRGQ